MNYEFISKYKPLPEIAVTCIQNNDKTTGKLIKNQLAASLL